MYDFLDFTNTQSYSKNRLMTAQKTEITIRDQTGSNISRSTDQSRSQ